MSDSEEDSSDTFPRISLTEGEKAKRFRLFRNGDPFFFGCQFTLNRRRIPTWEAFLDSVTAQVRATKAVRSIRTPNSGTRVYGLEELQDNSNYVAVSDDRFKKLGYLNLHLMPTPRRKKRRIRESRPEDQNRSQTTGRMQRIPTDVISIHVYSNRKDFEPAKRVTLTHQMINNWDIVLREITKKVDVTGGARRLFTPEGEEIVDSSQLQSGRFYVAVGQELGGFRRAEYGAQRPAFNVSPSLRRRKKLEPIARPPPPAPKRPSKKLHNRKAPGSNLSSSGGTNDLQPSMNGEAGQGLESSLTVTSATSSKNSTGDARKKKTTSKPVQNGVGPRGAPRNDHLPPIVNTRKNDDRFIFHPSVKQKKPSRTKERDVERSNGEMPLADEFTEAPPIYAGAYEREEEAQLAKDGEGRGEYDEKSEEPRYEAETTEGQEREREREEDKPELVGLEAQHHHTSPTEETYSPTGDREGRAKGQYEEGETGREKNGQEEERRDESAEEGGDEKSPDKQEAVSGDLEDLGKDGEQSGDPELQKDHENHRQHHHHEQPDGTTPVDPNDSVEPAEARSRAESLTKDLDQDNINADQTSEAEVNISNPDDKPNPAEENPHQAEVNPDHLENTPKPEDVGSDPLNEASENQEVASPKEDEASPKEEEASPKEGEASPNKEEPSPNQDEASPKEEEASPNKEEASPSQEEANPKQEEASPTEEEASPNPVEISRNPENISPYPGEARPKSLTEREGSPKQEEEEKQHTLDESGPSQAEEQFSTSDTVSPSVAEGNREYRDSGVSVQDKDAEQAHHSQANHVASSTERLPLAEKGNEATESSA